MAARSAVLLATPWALHDRWAPATYSSRRRVSVMNAFRGQFTDRYERAKQSASCFRSHPAAGPASSNPLLPCRSGWRELLFLCLEKMLLRTQRSATQLVVRHFLARKASPSAGAWGMPADGLLRTPDAAKLQVTIHRTGYLFAYCQLICTLAGRVRVARVPHLTLTRST